MILIEIPFNIPEDDIERITHLELSFMYGGDKQIFSFYKPKKEFNISSRVNAEVMQLPDFLEKTIEGRSLLLQITFLLADTFHTHPEKITVDTVCELIKIIRQSA